MSETAVAPSAFLYFWPRYGEDTRNGAVRRLNQNSPSLAEAQPGDVLWAFAPIGAGRYAFVARLAVARVGENAPASTERQSLGRWFVEADPERVLYFDPANQPDASQLIRELGLKADAAVLGQSFQGGAGVRRLSADASDVLAKAATAFSRDPRLTPEPDLPRVSIQSLQSRQAVLDAMAEHDRLGADSFLQRYGYGAPTSYWITHDGRRYPSKALLGVAWHYENPSRPALRASQFSGGERTVQRTAEALGFTVVVDAAAPLPVQTSMRQTPARARGPAYWWVNNKQTNRQEIGGGYLWSPKTNANGARNETYDNMGRVRAGDLVFAYAAQRIAHVGVATQAAVPAPKPDEFGNAGANWTRDGWMLPVRWAEVPSPLQPKSIIGDLRPHLPPLHSPLRPATGDGNQNVYLAAIPKALAGVLLPRLGVDEEALRTRGLAAGIDPEVLDRADAVLEKAVTSDAGLSATEREAVIAARRGQGRFRAAVMTIEPRCRLTGVADPRFLRASHIRPWRACETQAQRLDGENGLMLTPTADHLFDQGYISFADDGALLVSPHIEPDDLVRLGISDDGAHTADRFSVGQRGYLDYHRSTVLLT